MAIEYVIEVDESTMHLARDCMVCRESFELGGHGDNRTICPDCCEAIKSIKDKCKKTGLPDQKAVNQTTIRMKMKYHFEHINRSYNAILESLEKDEAGFASTQLHYFRIRLDELDGIRSYLLSNGDIDIEQNSSILNTRRDIQEAIRKRLQERLLWLARGIDESISIRKAKGIYEGEFDTATILANAFNDILGDTYGKNFTGHPEKEQKTL